MPFAEGTRAVPPKVKFWEAVAGAPFPPLAEYVTT